MMFTKTVIKQGRKIIELDKAKKELQEKYSNLRKRNARVEREYVTNLKVLESAQVEFYHILDNIQKGLEANNYGQPQVKIRKAIEELQKQKDIIRKDLEIEKVLVTDYQSDN